MVRSRDDPCLESISSGGREAGLGFRGLETRAGDGVTPYPGASAGEGGRHCWCESQSLRLKAWGPGVQLSEGRRRWTENVPSSALLFLSGPPRPG